MLRQTEDLRIRDIHEISSPEKVQSELPLSANASRVTSTGRLAIHNILHGQDDRLVVICGPCSIHDPVAAIEYAKKLKPLADDLADNLLIVMRVYFEKPRTTVGWKGLINDPNLDNSFDINKGVRVARQLLLDINEIGLPAGTEFLDLISPQYFGDLIAWGAIGARTTESQGHRELASGLSCPVGFKNGTSGNIKIAVDAIGAASRPHHFLSVTKSGHSAIVATEGNEDCHVILRGGKLPNFDSESVSAASDVLEAAKLPASLMIDFSHANSLKQHKNQLNVSSNVAKQLENGEQRISGVMIESHLIEGNQQMVEGQEPTYGQSITDACIGWDDTETVLRQLAAAVSARRQSK
jgi:3-deoxy-7-phosphoheptulonate synthase